MDDSEFDSVAWMLLGELASPPRSDKEAVPTSSRANEDDVDCGIFSVAEEVDSASCPVPKVLECVTPSVEKEVDSLSLGLWFGSGRGRLPGGPICGKYIR